MAVDTSALMAIVLQSLIQPARCHCERSEAISCPSRSDDPDCFVASLLAMTGSTVFLSRTTAG
jgi:hypothetical protein